MTKINTPQLSPSLLKTNIFNEQFLYSINRDSFSQISATVIFDTEFKDKIFKENSLYIIIGTDSGLLPKYIQSLGIPAGTRYIFVEPNEILDELNLCSLLDNLNPDITITTYTQWEKEAANYKIAEYSYINGIVLLSAICAQSNNLEIYSELTWQLTESVQITHWKYSISLSTEMFILRQIENIAENKIPAKILENAYQGQTVIILAGGPSLSEILPWVKEKRNELVVFAVSRISKQLLNADITPDFIFSVDPQQVSFDISHPMLSFTNPPILINSYHIFPGLLNQWQGTSLYLGTRIPWQSPLNVDNIDSCGPTVTNSAISTAEHFGFSTILLAGVDLCYAKNGSTHAQGSAEQLAGPKYDTTSLQVETYSGENRGTGQDYFFALQTIINQASSITQSGKKIINLAKNAAKAEGISHILPENIELSQPLKPALSIAHKHIDLYNEQFNSSIYLSDLISELKKANHNIKAIETLAKKANQINSAMYNSSGSIENYKDKKKLDDIEKTFNKKYISYSFLVKKFGVRQFIKITSPHNDTSTWDAVKVQEVGKTYYDAYQKGAYTLSSLIEKAIVRTLSRQEENKESPNFELLFTQWDKDISHKRAELWLNKQKNALLPQEISKEFSVFSKKFTDYTHSNGAKLKSAMELARANIEDVKNKAKILFNNKQLTELVELKEKLLIDERNRNKTDYIFLLSAYISELEKNNDSALDYYHQILNFKNTSLLEQALNRITSISIEQENHQNAFLALECLSQISPTYLPYYAESARILGETLIAIDGYNTYISTFPQDIVAQLKLASLYISNHTYDAAEIMLDHILKESPDLETAIILKKKIKNQQ